jgi:hypothetical protein
MVVMEKLMMVKLMVFLIRRIVSTAAGIRASLTFFTI